MINRLSLEKYLYGVLKLEISPDWPLSTLSAQAIVARTYAFKRLKEAKTYITNITDDQVYGGVEAEDPRVRIAVDLTRGEILTYKNEPIEAFYHACSGGYVAGSEDVWGKKYPYLIAHKDPFSLTSPYSRWTVEISKQELKKMLKMHGKEVKNIKFIKIIEKDKSGRVLKLLLGDEKNFYVLKGVEFRKIVGQNVLKSTLFSIKKEDSVFVFQGKGWGHGVGMSQWGAKKMGEMGYSIEEILKFYYPGTKIQKIY